MCNKYLSGFDALSEFLGGVPRSTLNKWVNEGKIKKYSIGDSRRVFFKPEEIDKALNSEK